MLKVVKVKGVEKRRLAKSVKSMPRAHKGVPNSRSRLSTREGEDNRKVECGRYVEAASRTGTQVNGGE